VSKRVPDTPKTVREPHKSGDPNILSLTSSMCGLMDNLQICQILTGGQGQGLGYITMALPSGGGHFSSDSSLLFESARWSDEGHLSRI